MARKKNEPEVPVDAEAEAVTETGPSAEQTVEDQKRSVLMRGVLMLLMVLLFEVAKTLLFLSAVLQFLWLLIAKEKNQFIAEFGEDLADWLSRVARFQTVATEDKPFPFAKWGRDRK